MVHEMEPRTAVCKAGKAPSFLMGRLSGPPHSQLLKLWVRIAERPTVWGGLKSLCHGPERWYGRGEGCLPCVQMT